MTVGWKTHFFRNLFVIGANNNNIELVFALNYFIAYPVTTAYKRMLCQVTIMECRVRMRG